jgi:N-formylglutamate amidohydrolase
VTDMPTSFYGSLDSELNRKETMVLYRIEKANIPVILTAPHSGSSRSGSLTMMARPLLPGVVTRGDLHTLELLVLIDEYIRRRTCNEKRPHVVAARFHRQFIDANRNSKVLSQVAYHPDCSSSKETYEEYHGRIENCISHSLDGSPHSRALLLDIHGMGPYSDHVIVGTLNGQTCTTSGHQSISQPHMGFLWHLRGLLGTTILPLAGYADFPQYSGGYTVARHGGGRVDALQLEFGGFLRTAELRNQVAEAVGEAILRTIHPMKTFLQTMAQLPSVRWRNDDVISVEEKLRLARCFTPVDIVERISHINKAFEKHGARKFFKKTLRMMMDMIENTNTSENKLKLAPPAAVPFRAKVLPSDFMMCNHRNLVTPPCLSPASLSVCDPRAFTAVDNSAANLTLSIGPATFLSNYQRNIIRRIFIYGGDGYFDPRKTTREGNCVEQYVDDESSLQSGLIDALPPGVIPIEQHETEKEGASEEEAFNSDALVDTRDCFNMAEFLRGCESCPAVLIGFTVASDALRSGGFCRETGDPVDRVRGHLLTFSDCAQFASKLDQWLRHSRSLSLPDKEIAMALVPILARNTFVYGSGGGDSNGTFNGVNPAPTTDQIVRVLEKEKEKPSDAHPSFTGEEYLYNAYVRYQLADHEEGIKV